MKPIVIIPIIIIVLVTFLAFEATFIVSDQDNAIITSFGKPFKIVDGEGRHFKMPFVQDVFLVSKSVFVAEDSFQCPTKDGTYIDVKSKSQWKIIDPLKYLKFLRSFDKARSAATMSIRSEIFKVFSETPIEIIKECPEVSPKNYCAPDIHHKDITKGINDIVNQRGIDVVHVDIKVKLSPPNTSKTLLKSP